MDAFGLHCGALQGSKWTVNGTHVNGGSLSVWNCGIELDFDKRPGTSGGSSREQTTCVVRECPGSSSCSSPTISGRIFSSLFQPQIGRCCAYPTETRWKQCFDMIPYLGRCCKGCCKGRKQERPRLVVTQNFGEPEPAGNWVC